VPTAHRRRVAADGRLEPAAPADDPERRDPRGSGAAAVPRNEGLRHELTAFPGPPTAPPRYSTTARPSRARAGGCLLCARREFVGHPRLAASEKASIDRPPTVPASSPGETCRARSAKESSTVMTSTWKEQLQGRMPPAWAEEIDVFETQLHLRKQGKIEEK